MTKYVVTYTSMAVEAESPEAALEWWEAGDSGGGEWEAIPVDAPPVEFSRFAETMTESEFAALWLEAHARFGIVGVYFTRRDADEALEGKSQPPLTDEEWALVRNSYHWCRIPRALTDQGDNLISAAIIDTMLDRDNEEN